MAPPTKPSVAVVWFKATDLRTHDHGPLCAAHASGVPVLHLFIADPRWYHKSTPLGGFPRMGAARARFQLEAVRDLAQRLEEAGHTLVVRRSVSTALCFKELCEDFSVKAVYASHEICDEELRVERSVREVLARAGAGPLELFWMNELHQYEDLPEDVRRKGASGFSGYRRTFADRCRVRPPLPRPDLRKTAPGARWEAHAGAAGKEGWGLPADVEELTGHPREQGGAAAASEWVGGETQALAHLEQYFFGSDAIALDFVGATNFPHDGHSNTKEKAGTKLSPWLAHGCLSARLVHSELKRYERERGKTDATARLVHELYFRDFVRFSSLLRGSKIFKLEGIFGRHPPGGWLQDAAAMLDPWRLGQTGFPLVDAAMRELQATGHCSHSGREVAAWFLVCDLGLDWRLGAEWFESALIDYEPASNWFNWAFTIVPRATGGNAIQEEAKPLRPPRTRLQTLEVIYWAAQSDPDAEYIKRWVPELRGLPGPLAREPWRATEVEPRTAERDRARPEEEWAPAVGKERERIGWARRTFPAGGSDVAVWWGCSRAGAGTSGGSRDKGGGSAPPTSGAVEKRTDPEDGQACTRAQLARKYKGRYSAAEVEAYWRDTCVPVEVRVDPADGKAYTLSELQAAYAGSGYSRRELDKYFRTECSPPAPAKPRQAGAGTGGEVAAAGEPTASPKGWPVGYPLPLFPPASFYSIEEIADHSRRSQARKEAKSARLRQEWGARVAPAPEGGSLQEGKECGSGDKAPARPRRRWKAGEAA